MKCPAFFCCCPSSRSHNDSIDEIFTSCLFLHDRDTILDVMDQHHHTPATLSRLQRPSDHCTLLLVACIAGDAVLVELLLEQEEVHCEDSIHIDREGNTPLLCACLGGHVAVVNVLLQSTPLLVNRPNKQGTTPLMAAAWRGHLQLVQQLAQFPGVDLMTRDRQNRAAKDLSQEWGHQHVVEWIESVIKNCESSNGNV